MKWQKKPVTIDAFQFMGEAPPLQKWIAETEVSYGTQHPGAAMQFYSAMPELKDEEGTVIRARTEPYLMVFTLEGEMRASVHDFIIRGIKGEYYPCKPDIFLESYDAIDDDGVPLTDELLAKVALMPPMPGVYDSSPDA